MEFLLLLAGTEVSLILLLIIIVTMKKKPSQVLLLPLILEFFKYICMYSQNNYNCFE
jgi:hypothetical protein